MVGLTASYFVSQTDRSPRYIFFLCGFGYFIDLLYAQAFGLVAPALQNELGFSGQYQCASKRIY